MGDTKNANFTWSYRLGRGDVPVVAMAEGFATCDVFEVEALARAPSIKLTMPFRCQHFVNHGIGEDLSDRVTKCR